MFILGCTRSSLLCVGFLVAARKGCSLIAVRRLLKMVSLQGLELRLRSGTSVPCIACVILNHRTTWEAHRLVFSLQFPLFTFLDTDRI